jgi:hypothetical protein
MLKGAEIASDFSFCSTNVGVQRWRCTPTLVGITAHFDKIFLVALTIMSGTHEITSERCPLAVVAQV